MFSNKDEISVISTVVFQEILQFMILTEKIEAKCYANQEEKENLQYIQVININ